MFASNFCGRMWWYMRPGSADLGFQRVASALIVDPADLQGIAGGGENDETPLQAAVRESWEEGGLFPETPFLQLD